MDVNVGGTSLDPRPAPASLGFPRTLPVMPLSLDGTQAEQWVTQSGCCRAHHTQPWGAGRATELSPLPPRETQPPRQPVSSWRPQDRRRGGRSERVLRWAPRSSVLLRGHARSLSQRQHQDRAPAQQAPEGSPGQGCVLPRSPAAALPSQGAGPPVWLQGREQGCPAPPLLATPAGCAQAVPSSRTSFLLRPTLQLQPPGGFLCKVTATRPPPAPAGLRAHFRIPVAPTPIALAPREPGNTQEPTHAR